MVEFTDYKIIIKKNNIFIIILNISFLYKLPRILLQALVSMNMD